jgi:hypothetical protein
MTGVHARRTGHLNFALVPFTNLLYDDRRILCVACIRFIHMISKEARTSMFTIFLYPSSNIYHLRCSRFAYSLRDYLTITSRLSSLRLAHRDLLLDPVSIPLAVLAITLDDYTSRDRFALARSVAAIASRDFSHRRARL